METEEKVRPFVVIGTPQLYGEVVFPYLRSAIEMTNLFSSVGIDWAFILQPGDPYLAKVRNTIATKFLNDYPKATHLFFIDADLGWDAKAGVAFIKKDLDMMAGIYPKKAIPVEFPCELYLGDDEKFVKKDGWYRANAVPTGFLCIRRDVLMKMAEGKGVYKDIDGKERYNIFQMGFNAADGQWWGEDYAFCRQWRDLGGEIWVYPDIEFSHTGTKAYVNTFAKSVKAFEERSHPVKDMDTGKVVNIGNNPNDETIAQLGIKRAIA